MVKNFLLILFFVISFLSCTKSPQNTVTVIEPKNLESQMIDSYKAGVEALEKGDALYAIKKFNEAELLYPQSQWAPKSSLMAAYAYWTQAYYSNSISELKRFLKLYSNDENLDYAYYLLAMNYYDSIIDEKKDLRPLNLAKEYFILLNDKFPESDYAADGKYKLELIQDILAAKEIYIARHYIKKEKWIAAINRLKIIINEYDTTVYVEEALHRLVEVHYIIGLENLAQKYAKTLGYNYQSGEWYEQSYKIFNQDYTIKKIEKEKTRKNKLLDRIRSFF